MLEGQAFDTLCTVEHNKHEYEHLETIRDYIIKIGDF
jgi:hypothetical protein